MNTTTWANQLTGAKEGGPQQLAIRTPWAARFAQFGRSATNVGRKMPYFSLMFLAGALLACIGCDRTTPAQTFQTATRKPMPSSVRILNSRTRAVTAVDHYLHFTISPEDLAAIVQGGAYEKDEKPGLDFHLWKGRPAWWTPENLGHGAVEFSHTPDEKGDTWRRRLFVNSSSNEVYCYAAPD